MTDTKRSTRHWIYSRKIIPKATKFQEICGLKNMLKNIGFTTLFRYKLNSGWRLVYTIYGTKHEKVCTILEAFDHKEYEKRFGY